LLLWPNERERKIRRRSFPLPFAGIEAPASQVPRQACRR
jgi:hypothetical protein